MQAAGEGVCHVLFGGCGTAVVATAVGSHRLAVLCLPQSFGLALLLAPLARHLRTARLSVRFHTCFSFSSCALHRRAGQTLERPTVIGVATGRMALRAFVVWRCARGVVERGMVGCAWCAVPSLQ